MAGACVGCGLDTTSGTIEVAGTRSEEWPAEYDERSDVSGLRCDPVTGQLWVPPDSEIVMVSDQGDPKTLVPTVTGLALIEDLSVQLTTSSRSQSLVHLTVMGGQAGIHAVDGNWWGVERYVTVTIDGVTTTLEPNNTVVGILNTTNGTDQLMGFTVPVDAVDRYTIVPAGKVVRLRARYQLNKLAVSVNGANSVTWRCPRLMIVAQSIPEQ